MKISHQEILDLLPYKKPFIFVDKLLDVNSNSCKGQYTFRENEYFYAGHFKNRPITPGVILGECMAQIGVVCLGIYLMKNENFNMKHVVMSNINLDYYKPVFPGETVTVISEKVYFRFQKLKCNIKMHNNNNDLICTGTISGMIINFEI